MKPRVWLIDSQQWPRACLRAELLERGWDAVGFQTVSQALAAIGSINIAKPEVVVIEFMGSPPMDLEMEALMRHGIPTIVLGGHVELNRDAVSRHDWAAVLQRPFTIGEAADAVQRTAARRTKPSETPRSTRVFGS